jgi:hypothetical protein
MGTSVEDGWRESSRPELLAVCSQKLAALVEHALLDHLVGSHQNRVRDRQPERLGCPEVDDQLELRGLLDREVGGLGALEDLVDVARGETPGLPRGNP